jgi:hypothetical protein
LSRSPPKASFAPSSRRSRCSSRPGELALVDDRADVRAVLQRVVDLQLLHPLGQRVDEPVVDAFGDDQARRGRAALAGREEGAVDGALSTAMSRSASSSTTSGFLPPISSWNFACPRDAGHGDLAPGLDRAGEADRVDVGMIEQRLADHRAAAHDEVEHALRQAGARQDLGQRPGAAGHEVGRLEHDAVAVGQRRRDLPGRDGDREVPRRDDADHADRLAR